MNPKSVRILLACIACVFCGAVHSQAAQDAVEADGKASDTAHLATALKNADGVGTLLQSLTSDMPATTAPATFLLGLSGTTVPRVSTFRAFGAQIANAVGDDGKIKSAVAAEVNPRLAWKPVRWTDYKASPLLQVLTRTTLSFATATSSGTGASSAVGLQSVLYSAEVPRLIEAASTGQCAAVAEDFAKSTEVAASAPFPVANGKPMFPGMTPDQEAQVKACKATIEGLLTKWNPTALTVGLGQSYYSADSTVGGLHRDASAGWITASWGHDFVDGQGKVAESVEDRLGMGLTLHARRTLHGRATDPADSTVQVNENSNLYGANLRVGYPRVGAVVEYSLERSKAPPLSDEHRKRFVAAVEYRLMTDLYLSAGLGSDTGRRDGKNQRLALMNLQWGFSSTPVLK